ncbi:HEAT repeat domain-containing protein [Corallococcus macrosporus]|uniref:HEAT repeat-containing PBS lyase n=1 Tax=Myxococcus fulvus (strain ATCC BAA-855 / HW-1) TaxID=483219 RepID=F8C898_MYXFH|nr:HEAT repeat domain-containing protein [Corallococcus macrosporus]AEI68225.1 HEAT repeat-containing PBS lyase [Corallococcus macrosporus]
MSPRPELPAAEEARYLALQSLDPCTAGVLEILVVGLHDESWRVRHVAAEALKRMPASSELAARLIAVLGERGETGARNAAAEALAGLGGVALGPLVALLAHPDPDQRKFAADILGQLGQREAEAALVRALSDADLNVRVSAAEALGRIGGAKAMAALEALLEEPEPLLRLSALEGLTLLRHAAPLPVVKALLEDPRLQRSAYRMLGLIPDADATARICQGLTSGLRSVREAALSALGTQAADAAGPRRGALEAGVREALLPLSGLRPRLAEALASDDVLVRAGALVAVASLADAALALPVAECAREARLLREVLHTLGRLGPDGGRALLRGLEELSLPARAAAAEALVELVDASAVAPLCAVLEWVEDELRAVVVRALGRTGASTAVSPLVALLEEPAQAGAATRALAGLAESCRPAVLEALEDAVARRATPAAVAALARVGGVPALPTLKRLARDEDARWRTAAVVAACELDGDVGRELVRAALADESVPVRIAGVRALARLGGADAGALLSPALRDEDASVRVAAVEAAGDSGALDRVPDLVALTRDADGALAVAAVRALARMGAAGPGVLRDAAGHSDVEVVKAALAAGAESSAGVTLALSLLRHARWDVRAAAARVLGDSAGPECLVAAREALEAESDALALRALSEAVERLLRR